MTTVHTVKTKVKIYFVAFSEYMNFIQVLLCDLQSTNLCYPILKILSGSLCFSSVSPFSKKNVKPSTFSKLFLIFQVSLVLGANIQTMPVLLSLERRTLLILKTTCQRWKNDPRKLRKKHPWRKNQHFTSKMLTIIKVCIGFFVCLYLYARSTREIWL